MNPATLEEARKDEQRSTLLSKKIWPQGCEKPDASNVHFESQGWSIVDRGTSKASRKQHNLNQSCMMQHNALRLM